jgi:ketosteroid isomerase-like protein
VSQENVDTVRRAVEAFNRRELLLEIYAPEAEWIEDPRYPGAETFRGREGIRRSVEKWWETWSAVTLRVEEFIDAGDRVVMWGALEARARDPEVTIGGQFGGVWELRDGLIVRVRVLGGREEALEAAGLTETRQ